MSMKITVHMLVAGLALVATGCQSAEEKCNVARVAAHDAWATYAESNELRSFERSLEQALFDNANSFCEEEGARPPCPGCAVNPNGDPGCINRHIMLSRFSARESAEVVRDAALGRAVRFRDAFAKYQAAVARGRARGLPLAGRAHDLAVQTAEVVVDACLAVQP